MGRCAICEQKSKEIAAEIGVCRSCILDKPGQEVLRERVLRGRSFLFEYYSGLIK